jgi:VCBS repeat-containing protein
MATLWVEFSYTIETVLISYGSPLPNPSQVREIVPGVDGYFLTIGSATYPSTNPLDEDSIFHQQSFIQLLDGGQPVPEGEAEGVVIAPTINYPGSTFSSFYLMGLGDVPVYYLLGQIAGYHYATSDDPFVPPPPSGVTETLISQALVTTEAIESHDRTITVDLSDTWSQITIDDLFTTGVNFVDFNHLTGSQQLSIAFTHPTNFDGLGGGDYVTLPSKSNYDLTLGWTDSTIFQTDSLLGAGTNVSGTDGNYNIRLGAGHDSVSIVGDGNTHIVGGLGLGSVSFDGDGSNSIDLGLGGISATLSGGGQTTFNFTAATEALEVSPLSYTGSLQIGGLQVGNTIHLNYLLVKAPDIDAPTLAFFNPALSGNTVNLNYDLSSSSSRAVIQAKYDGSGGTILTVVDGLFTAGDDVVNFGNLTYSEKRAISNGADVTHGQGGNDLVILSNSQAFETGSRANDFYLVSGGSGDYNITEGAGTEFVAINGTGTTTVTVGTGTDTLSIAGGGTLIANRLLTSGSETVQPTYELKGVESGSLSFSSDGVKIQIAGKTMPTAVVGSFTSNDTIDLKGVAFDVHSAAVLQTSNNGVLLNNVLHVFANGDDYRLQLDPNQAITGGFIVSDDGSGGTQIKASTTPVVGNPVITASKAYSTFDYPYKAVVFIKVADGTDADIGTGFVIGPHSILTAAHVVIGADGKALTNLSITADNNASIGPVSAANIHYDIQNYNPDPLFKGNPLNSQYDFAVINVAQDLSAFGKFELSAGYSGGTVNVTGYPGSASGHQVNDIGTVHASSVANTFVEDTLTSEEGQSGGPLWFFDGNAAHAVGLVSSSFLGTSYDVSLTSTDVDKITGWKTTKLVDGYISGATVFSDDNDNGHLDSGEASSTTDATGSFVPLNGIGPVVAFVGTDTSTGLPFKGQLSAPSGSNVISPLTTLLTDLGSGLLAQQKVLASLGLSSSLDLTTFDPIAAAQVGNADGAATDVAVAKVYDTVSLIASALAGAGGDFATAGDDAFAAIAAAIGGAGISLTNPADVSALIAGIAQSEGLAVPPGVADSVAAIIAANNALLDQKILDGVTGDTLLNDVAAIERVTQGTASNAVQQADNDSSQLQSLVDAFTGSKLDDAISTALSHLGDTGDATAPTLTPVSDQTLEATSSAGATVSFATTATDLVDGTDPVVFKEGNKVVHSGDTFSLGNHTITANSIDAAGNPASETFKINVVDTTAPTLTEVSDQTLEATGAAGASALFEASATDLVDGADPIIFKEGDNVVHSGDTFSIGTHTISANTVDAAGNPASGTFKVNVVDTTAPTLTPVSDQTLEAATALGAAAIFAATATDVVDGTDTVIFKEGNTVVHSGDVFSLGSHTITASTVDAAGNPSSETFKINVVDTTAPTLTPIGDQTLQATTAAGASVSFAATASDLVDGADPVVFKEGDTVVHSGDIFGIGAHTITASAMDAAGNPASETFEINVAPTTTNHDPIAVSDSNGVAKGKVVIASAANGVLSNDSDPDGDQLSVGSVNGSAASVGHSVQGTYGTLVLNADGSYSYEATAKTLPSQTLAQDAFTYTAADGHGGLATATLTFSVFDPSASYKAGSNTALSGENGKSVLDGSAGHDVLMGGNGADELIGGDGDTMTGGNGPDQFVFRANFGSNTIKDFDVKADHLQFDKSLFASASALLDHTTDTAQGALISDAHGDSVLLLGVMKAQVLFQPDSLLLA